MIWTILFWLSVAYLAVVVLSRLFIAVMMVADGYAAMGTRGALMAAGINFLVNLWDLGKFALTILILVFLVRSCREEKPHYAGDNKELDAYLTSFGVIGNETRQYGQTYVDLVAKYRGDDSPNSYALEQKDYQELRQKGIAIISKGTEFAHLYQQAKSSIQNEAKNYQDDHEISQMIDLLLEQVDVGKDLIDKSIRFITVNNEVIDLSMRIGSEELSNTRKKALAEQAMGKYHSTLQISDSVNQAKRKFDDLNYERLKIFNALKGTK